MAVGSAVMRLVAGSPSAVRRLFTRGVARAWGGILALGGLAVFTGAATIAWTRWLPLPGVWAGMGLGVLCLMFGAGSAINGAWRDVLIDQRNRISLSRLQVVIWTIVLLSAFATAALHNVASGHADPLAVAIPAELWLVIGISGASLAGKALILEPKHRQQPTDQQKQHFQKTWNARSQQPAPQLSGVVVENQQPSQARWTDMFTGDEEGNSLRVDLGKLQLFCITLLLVFVYGAEIWELLAAADAKLTALPPLASGAVALLGLSHAGYLASKAASHSQP